MPLASDLDAAALPVDVLIREAHDLDDAQPLDPHEVDDEEVAQAAQGVLVRGEPLTDLLDLVDGEVLVVLVEVLRVAQLQVGAGVLGDEGEALCDLVKGTDRSTLDHEGRCAVSACAHLLHVDADLVVVYVGEGVEVLLHAPVEEQANRQLVGVACVRCGRAARDVAREILVKVGDEVLRRDGILPHVHRYRAVHAPYGGGRSVGAPCGYARLCRAAAAVGFVCCQQITRFLRV